MPWFPRKTFLDWPEDAVDLPAEKVVELYENGFAGALYSPEEFEKFVASQPHPDGDKVCHDFGLADTGAGKLVIPFVHVLETWPGAWQSLIAQGRGDCVSWSSRNGCLLTFTCDITSGQPDEKTGKPEEKPDVPQEGIDNDVLSTEAIYWYRGYDGDGWYCPTAAQVCCTKGGVVLRKNYTELGFDLTRYSARQAGLYGRRSPTSQVEDMTNDHLIHQATVARSFEAGRDLLFNGYGLSTCGGEGLSSQRDENGVSRRSGSWAHAMAYVGADDRDVIKAIYNEPLFLILNSHGRFNRGSRDIYQSASMVPPAKKALWEKLGIVNPATGNIMIPHGSCWVRYSEIRNRDMTAFSGAAGWPAKDLPLDWTR